MSDLLLRLLYVAAVDHSQLDGLRRGALERAHDVRGAFEAAALESGLVSVDEARRVDFGLAASRLRTWYASSVVGVA